MKITVEDVRKIAGLARLELDEDKVLQFAEQLGGILEYMDLLGQLDTSGIEPLYSPVELATPLREDRAVQTRTREEILANAPDEDGQFFIVPKIV